MFDWAKDKRAKGAVKLHLLLDHAGYLPTYALLTDGQTHEVRVARGGLQLAAGSIIVIDRGYLDFGLFARWTAGGVWFVTKMKHHVVSEVIEERVVPQQRQILRDQLIVLSSGKGKWKYKRQLRRALVCHENKQEWAV